MVLLGRREPFFVAFFFLGSQGAKELRKEPTGTMIRRCQGNPPRFRGVCIARGLACRTLDSQLLGDTVAGSAALFWSGWLSASVFFLCVSLLDGIRIRYSGTTTATAIGPGLGGFIFYFLVHNLPSVPPIYSSHEAWVVGCKGVDRYDSCCAGSDSSECSAS